MLYFITERKGSTLKKKNCEYETWNQNESTKYTKRLDRYLGVAVSLQIEMFCLHARQNYTDIIPTCNRVITPNIRRALTR